MRSTSPAAASTDRADASRITPGQSNGPDTTLAVTLSGSTGEISKIEAIEPSGRRRELTPEEYLALADADDADDIEAIAEDAYRTAVTDALGEGDETDEDSALRRLLIGRFFVRRKLKRGARRLLLLRLLRESKEPAGHRR
jgi:hypothetical protein